MTSNICHICNGTGWEFDNETETYRRCECYEKEKLQRLWNKYGIDPKDIKKLNEYKPIDDIQISARDKAVKYIKNFENMKDTKENGFGLFGQPGAGKTHILLSIGAALITKGIEVIYMPYVEVMRELKATAMDNEYYIKLSSSYMKAKVLIIDDLFKDKLKNGELVGELREADIKHLYPILNYRYLNNLPTLVSTECIPDILQKLDNAQCGRMIERCGDNITIFKGPKYNYRMRKFVK
ncbi:MerR family transcriptional regulator [Clostridium botulinum]|nr:MerR family transcriptional regulator [Clostridium botulinum]MBY6830708.1 ATP-binding protein [Clostridium botulinum]MBY6940432.1 ATP-binding protein [Clostridium botulinum]MBY6961169.1 ATP-binding protein [Clostridium botulinum]NFF84920.1 MerR family transcriptional regulator [Clostridium botulinum]